jgi:GTP cyclohydrolase I
MTSAYSDESIIQDLITLIGDDATRGGLHETPARVIKAWKHWGSGYGVTDDDVAKMLKTFEDGAEDYDQFVIVKDIPVYSTCEHHLATIFGTASIGYIPKKRIVGLSKFSRLVNVYARRLQVQERLTNQIAQAIQIHLEPKAVGVVLECRHMCMESRGIQTPGTITVTSAMLGQLRTEPETRAEFLRLMGK